MLANAYDSTASRFRRFDFLHRTCKTASWLRARSWRRSEMAGNCGNGLNDFAPIAPDEQPDENSSTRNTVT